MRARRLPPVAARLLLAAALPALAACRGEAPATAPAAPRPPVEVAAAVDRAVATTGDLIRYRVTVDHAPGWEVEIPEAGSEIAGFRIVDAGRESPRARGERVVEERWYTLRADLVGSYVLPPIEVSYRRTEGGEEVAGTVATSEIFVEVESVLPADGEAADIRDIKPLRRLERPWRWWLAAGAALALAAAAVALWLWRRRRARPSAPPLAAHEEAFRALAALRELDLSDPEVVRRFYFGLSETVRAYIEGRFGLNATDLTSEEILARSGELAGLGLPEVETLERFLHETDRVKFAEHRPGESEIRDAYEGALGFVETTRPREPELAEAA